MPKVLCTLPNASDLISGIVFAPHDVGMLSVEIDDEQATAFAAIPGYEIVGAPEKKPEPTVDPEKVELQHKAESLGIKFKAGWGSDRLKVEIEAAEIAAAGDAK